MELFEAIASHSPGLIRPEDFRPPDPSVGAFGAMPSAIDKARTPIGGASEGRTFEINNDEFDDILDPSRVLKSGFRQEEHIGSNLRTNMYAYNEQPRYTEQRRMQDFTMRHVKSPAIAGTQGSIPLPAAGSFSHGDGRITGLEKFSASIPRSIEIEIGTLILVLFFVLMVYLVVSNVMKSAKISLLESMLSHAEKVMSEEKA